MIDDTTQTLRGNGTEYGIMKGFCFKCHFIPNLGWIILGEKNERFLSAGDLSIPLQGLILRTTKPQFIYIKFRNHYSATYSKCHFPSWDCWLCGDSTLIPSHIWNSGVLGEGTLQSITWQATLYSFLNSYNLLLHAENTAFLEDIIQVQ